MPTSSLRIAAAVAAILGCAYATAQEAQPIKLDIPAQRLDKALNAWADQTGYQVMIPADDPTARERKAPKIEGTYTPEGALKVLLASSDLKYRFVSERAVTIRSAAAEKLDPNAPKVPPHATPAQEPERPLALAQSRPREEEEAASDSSETHTSPQGGHSRLDLAEVVVTGTLIKRAEGLTPVKAITADAIRTQGYTNLSEVFDQLPQNFKAGASVLSNSSNAAGQGAINNYSYASGVNLRGLGPNATLILLNGRRIAPTALGSTTDISSIPVSAIDRVDVLTDGASSTYGSDAIAGVVNVVTKKPSDGVEVGARTASISKGKDPDYGAYATIGHTWNAGGFTLNYDYDRTEPLLAAERDFAAAAPIPSTLLPKQTKHSAYASLNQRFADSVSMHTDLLYSTREYLSHDLFSGFSLVNQGGKVQQVAVASDLAIPLGANWTGTLGGQYSKETDDFHIEYADFLSTSKSKYGYRVGSVDAKLEGAFGQISHSPIDVALGLSRRSEALNTRSVSSLSGVDSTPSTLKQTREVNSAYIEFLVPIVDEANSIPLIHRLSLSLSGRYDDYSDFGNTTNPKAALRWALTSSTTFRASYSHSFRAPELYLLNPNALNVGYVDDIPDASGSGTARALILDGTNVSLRAEKARTLSAGLDFAPKTSYSPTVSINYFEINFRDRIKDLVNERYYTALFTKSSELGRFVNLEPSIAEVNQQLTAPGRTIYNVPGGYCVAGTPDCNVDPTAIQAIGFLGYQNTASSILRGFDLDARASVAGTSGTWTVDESLTYLMDFANQSTPDAVRLQTVGTVYNPARFRSKLNVGWVQGVWSANARLNYVGSSKDTINPACAASACSISDWTTVDLSLSFRGSDSGYSALRGFRAIISIANLLDRNPPYVNSLNGINYDPVNADPLKRSAALSISKQW